MNPAAEDLALGSKGEMVLDTELVGAGYQGRERLVRRRQRHVWHCRA